MPGVSMGPNSRPLNDTIAETGPGIADDARAEGELQPQDLGADAERQAQALKESGWTGGGSDEPEAHPS